VLGYLLNTTAARDHRSFQEQLIKAIDNGSSVAVEMILKTRKFNDINKAMERAAVSRNLDKMRLVKEYGGGINVAFYNRIVNLDGLTASALILSGDITKEDAIIGINSMSYGTGTARSIVMDAYRSRYGNI